MEKQGQDFAVFLLFFGVLVIAPDKQFSRPKESEQKLAETKKCGRNFAVSFYT